METETEQKINEELKEWLEHSENPDRVTTEQIEQKRGEYRIRNKKAYSVLSISQLKDFLKKAKKESQKNYNGKINDAECIIIDWEITEEKYDREGLVQINFPKVR